MQRPGLVTGFSVKQFPMWGIISKRRLSFKNNSGIMSNSSKITHESFPKRQAQLASYLRTIWEISNVLRDDGTSNISFVILVPYFRAIRG